MKKVILFLLTLSLGTSLALAQAAPKANSTGGVSPHETTLLLNQHTLLIGKVTLPSPVG